MAIIHKTTMTPTKLELLAPWLPTQPWYSGTGSEPELGKAGGFRLDDPEGEVGIEFMVVTDASGDEPRAYHVPLSYRGAPLEGADHALIGTSEHGVLGRRWVYDGTHDPVLVAQLLALLQGRAEPQAQSLNDTPDPSITTHTTAAAAAAAATLLGPAAVDNGPHGTDLRLEASTGALTLHVVRALRPDQQVTDAQAHVTAPWTLPDGGERRAPFAVLRDAAR